VSDAAAVLRDVLAGIVYALEALEQGEPGIAATILRDLEDDLAAATQPRCPGCGGRAPTWELLDRHRIRDCHGLPGRRRR
jgi:hypothetical protein